MCVGCEEEVGLDEEVAGRLDGGGLEASSSSESDKVKSTATTFRFVPPSFPFVAPFPPFVELPLDAEGGGGGGAEDVGKGIDEVARLEVVDTAGEDRLELAFDEDPPSPPLDESFFPGLKGSQLPSSERLISLTSGAAAFTTS